MAIYRKINTTFWSDPFICDLSPEKKLFYLYLLTNERTKQCGIYDISKRQISFDLGIDIKSVSDNLVFFQKKGKLMFSEATNEIALRNWNRFNGSTSPKVITCIESEMKLVKDKDLIQYVYCIDTLSQEEETQTETQTEEEKENKGLVDPKDQPPPPPKIDFEKLRLFFNNNKGNMPLIKLMSEERKRRITLLQKKYGAKSIQQVIEKARDSDFLQGKKEKDTWVASFDWITTEKNFIKITEDNFLNNTPNGTKQPTATGTKKQFRFSTEAALEAIARKNEGGLSED